MFLVALLYDIQLRLCHEIFCAFALYNCGFIKLPVCNAWQFIAAEEISIKFGDFKHLVNKSTFFL
jgi:hypothetical protein